LEEANTEEEMAENIQALIDLLSSEILKHELSHIKGVEIVNANPEHCINLLQLLHEISCMLPNQNDEDGSDEEDSHAQNLSNSKGKHNLLPEGYDDDDNLDDMDIEAKMMMQ